MANLADCLIQMRSLLTERKSAHDEHEYCLDLASAGSGRGIENTPETEDTQSLTVGASGRASRGGGTKSPNSNTNRGHRAQDRRLHRADAQEPIASGRARAGRGRRRAALQRARPRVRRTAPSGVRSPAPASAWRWPRAWSSAAGPASLSTCSHGAGSTTRIARLHAEEKDLLRQLGRHKELIALLEEELAAAPDDSGLEEELIAALERAGQWDRAASRLAGRRKTDPASRPLRERYLRACEQAGLAEEVLALLQEDLAAAPATPGSGQKSSPHCAGKGNPTRCGPFCRRECAWTRPTSRGNRSCCRSCRGREGRPSSCGLRPSKSPAPGRGA